MIAVVASFTLTIWYSHYRMQRIERIADEIAFDAEPSIAHLGQARALLQRIVVAADLHSESRMVNDPAEAQRARDDEVRARRAIDLFSSGSAQLCSMSAGLHGRENGSRLSQVAGRSRSRILRFGSIGTRQISAPRKSASSYSARKRPTRGLSVVQNSSL